MTETQSGETASQPGPPMQSVRELEHYIEAYKADPVLFKALEEKGEARKGTQVELDDLFMVLADLEEKRANDKVKSISMYHQECPILTFSRNG